MKNSKKKTIRVEVKEKNIDVILHKNAVNNVDLFLTILSRKEDRLGKLIDYSQDESKPIEPRRKAYKLAFLMDALIKSMYRHGHQHLKLNMKIKK